VGGFKIFEVRGIGSAWGRRSGGKTDWFGWLGCWEMVFLLFEEGVE